MSSKLEVKSEKENVALRELKIVIKGAGDVATGIAHRLYRANLTRLVMTEIPAPLCVRRTVSFSEAVYRGSMEVEGVEATRIDTLDLLERAWEEKKVPIIVDPQWRVVDTLKPDVVVDAIMAKRNLGTRKEEAPLVIGVGPGFTAPLDVHIVVESNRGHDLGRVIYEGSAEPHTGVPGVVSGHGAERVLRAPVAGMVKHSKEIGEQVAKDELVLSVNGVPVRAPFDGMLRGLIREIDVEAGEKVGDVDPRGKKDFCYTISDKARALGGGVLEAVLHMMNK